MKLLQDKRQETLLLEFNKCGNCGKFLQDMLGFTVRECNKMADDTEYVTISYNEFLKLERFSADMRRFEKSFKGKKVFKVRRKRTKFEGYSK